MATVKDMYLADLPPHTCHGEEHFCYHHRNLCDALDEAAYWDAAGKLGMPRPRFHNATLRQLDAKLRIVEKEYWAGRDRAQSLAIRAVPRQDSMPRVAGPVPDVIFEHLDKLIPDLAGVPISA
jgi:hypothetical protein